MAFALLITILSAIAVGVFAILVSLRAVTPSLLALGSRAARLEREDAERLQQLEREGRPDKTLESMVKHTTSDTAFGTNCFIEDIYGREYGDKYFSRHPDDAKRLGWFEFIDGKVEKEIGLLLAHCPAGDERLRISSIGQRHGQEALTKYFFAHPEDAARFGWPFK